MRRPANKDSPPPAPSAEVPREAEDHHDAERDEHEEEEGRHEERRRLGVGPAGGAPDPTTPPPPPSPRSLTGGAGRAPPATGTHAASPTRTGGAGSPHGRTIHGRRPQPQPHGRIKGTFSFVEPPNARPGIMNGEWGFPREARTRGRFVRYFRRPSQSIYI